MIQNSKFMIIFAVMKHDTGIEFVYRLLEEGRLQEALTQLSALAINIGSWNLQGKIFDVQTTYGFLLKYATEGIADPNRLTMYDQLMLQAYQLTDTLRIAIDMEKRQSAYYQTLRRYRQQPPMSYKELYEGLAKCKQALIEAQSNDSERKEKITEAYALEHETLLEELFNRTWTSLAWSEEDSEQATQLLQDDKATSEKDRALFVASILMSLTRIMDVSKFRLLLQAATSDSRIVCGRASVAVLITLAIHSERIKMTPAAMDAWQEAQRHERLRNQLFEANLQLLMCRETPRLEKHIHDDIMPTIMKGAAKGSVQIILDNEDNDSLDNPEVRDKMNQMRELILSGADIYLDTFAPLKNNSFFSTAFHWFLPFDLLQADMYAKFHSFANTKSTLLPLIIHSNGFCDSDRYSFLLLMGNMPGAISTDLEENIKKQLPEGFDSQQANPERALQAKDYSRHFIQDLYRYYKLSVHRTDETDIFKHPFDTWKDTLTSSAYQQPQLMLIGEFLLQHNYLDEAFDLFYGLTRHDEGDTHAWRRLGLVLQKKSDYKRAIKAYEYADLMEPDNVWTIRHLAQCHKHLGSIEKATTYYRKIEAKRPEDLQIALLIGQCLTEQNKLDEALTYFHKVEYLSADKRQSRRAIGWCLFLQGKLKEATAQYERIINSGQPSAEDFLNYAHMLWLQGNSKEAILAYRHANNSCPDHSTFIRLLENDRAILAEHGISIREQQLIADAAIG
ncbi:MAG: tetratricopeptide repeat protein [Bacteroidales bacterium]|nr:tetratricopeptide repeat protein [Bacteroidales bacterium]